MLVLDFHFSHHVQNQYPPPLYFSFIICAAANFFWKAPDKTYFKFRGPEGLCCRYSPLPFHGNMKADTDKEYINEHDCV